MREAQRQRGGRARCEQEKARRQRRAAVARGARQRAAREPQQAMQRVRAAYSAGARVRRWHAAARCCAWRAVGVGVARSEVRKAPLGNLNENRTMSIQEKRTPSKRARHEVYLYCYAKTDDAEYFRVLAPSISRSILHKMSIYAATIRKMSMMSPT